MNVQVFAAGVVGLGLVACRHTTPSPSPHATTAAAIDVRPVATDRLPPGLAVPGTALDAIAWDDARGRNLLVRSEVIELRDEPGVRWSPTEFVTHVVTHLVGDAVHGRSELRWLCSNPDRSHGPRAPEVTDVDGDGVAEVTGLLDVQCGGERTALGWALEDGRDLTAPSDDGRYGCGGEGRMDASLRATGFEPAVRAQWQLAIGVTPDDAVAPSPALDAARAAYRADPIRPPGLGGTVEDALRWRDTTGDGVLLLTRRGAQITATFLRRTDATWTTTAQTTVGDDTCDGDDTTGFVPTATALADLDRDGTTEVTVAYTTGCVTDVSPVDAHLLVVEGTTRHDVVGHTWVGAGDDECASPRPLVFADDPMRQLLDRLAAAERDATRAR